VARKQKRLPRARGNCRHFAGTLAGCARNGLTAVAAAHAALINGASKIVCSINLDSCRKAAEPAASRWDYVLVVGTGSGPGIAMEVHHAAVSEVPVMIKKKEWAAALLSKECKQLSVQNWIWIVPNGQQPFFTPNDPGAKALFQAGIGFPKSALVVP
jgi:hypothetical protein